MSSNVKEPTPGQWGPNVTAYQAAMGVVALHIAQAFIKCGNNEVHAWARELAHELKREQCDIAPAVFRHLMRLTLDHPALAGDVPF